MASGKIKGITISFDGDTTKLGKALKDVDKKTRDLDKELKQVNNALKFNPTNVELWRQKQQLLSEKVGETKKRLDALKLAQKEMDASGVDKSSAEYRELQREIITTESKLKNFEKQLRQVGNVNLKALSEQFKQAGQKMQEIGTNMTKYVTGPIVGVGAASVKAFGEVQDGLNVVANKTGATGEELKEMQDTARELAKTLPTNFQDAGIAVGELNTRFGVTGKELESLGEQYIKFAKVNGADLNNSIDETQKALAAFGRGASDAPALLDTLTRASQLTGASVEDLTSGLIQNATAFQELGLGLDSSVMLMAQLEKSGANSETVMNGLRKALKNATAEGKPLDQALAELQDTIENGSGSMDGLTAAYDLFGKSGDQIYGAVKNGTLNFKELAIAAGDTSGTLNSVFEETLTPAEKFQITLNSVKDAGYQIGSTVMTILEPALKKLSGKMQELSEWWGKLSPETQKIITIVGLLVAAIGPMLVIIGKVATGISSIISLVNLVGGATTALSLGPMVGIVAAIAAVVAAGIWLYKNWDKIKAAAKALGDKIKSVWTSIKTATTNAWNSVKNAITAPFTAAYDKIKNIIKTIKGWFPLKLGKIFKGLKLPHFSIKGGFSLVPPRVPHIGVDWYDKGGIFDSPTVIGVGEKRPEFVGALDDLRDIVREESGNGPITINVYPSAGMNETELARKVEQALATVQRRRNLANGNI